MQEETESALPTTTEKHGPFIQFVTFIFKPYDGCAVIFCWYGKAQSWQVVPNLMAQGTLVVWLRDRAHTLTHSSCHHSHHTSQLSAVVAGEQHPDNSRVIPTEGVEKQGQTFIVGAGLTVTGRSHRLRHIAQFRFSPSCKLSLVSAAAAVPLPLAPAAPFLPACLPVVRFAFEVGRGMTAVMGLQLSHCEQTGCVLKRN